MLLEFINVERSSKVSYNIGYLKNLEKNCLFEVIFPYEYSFTKGNWAICQKRAYFIS